MHIALIALQGYNEIDLMIPLALLNRVKKTGWRVTVCCPESQVTSMNGVTTHAQATLEDAQGADAVLVGSGSRTREHVGNPNIMERLKLDPDRQLIGGQCSGTLVLAKLGLLAGVPACTDMATKPWVLEAGVQVLDQPIFARANVATAGGCLASAYLAAWVLGRTEGLDIAKSVLDYAAPVGEKETYVENAMQYLSPYL